MAKKTKNPEIERLEFIIQLNQNAIDDKHSHEDLNLILEEQIAKMKLRMQEFEK